jgi:hypothetical protein
MRPHVSQALVRPPHRASCAPCAAKHEIARPLSALETQVKARVCPGTAAPAAAGVPRDARTHQPAEPVCRIVGVGAGSDAVTAEAACDDAQCACAPCDTRDAATASGETTACNRSAQQ